MADTMEQRCVGCGVKNRVASGRNLRNARCGRCKRALFPSEPVVVTDATFADIVERSALPVLVDFWAPWCGPCRSMEPVLARFADERAGELAIAKVNVDENPQLAQRFAVRSIPALKLFKGPTAVAELNGAVPASTLTQFVDQHVAATR